MATQKVSTQGPHNGSKDAKVGTKGLIMRPTVAHRSNAHGNADALKADYSDIADRFSKPTQKVSGAGRQRSRRYNNRYPEQPYYNRK